MAVPNHIQVVLTPVAQTDFTAFAADSVRTLVLLRDVAAAVTARAHGLPDGVLNLGNVHAGSGRTQVTRSVFLTDLEKTQLRALISGGMAVTLQAVPNEPSAVL